MQIGLNESEKYRFFPYKNEAECFERFITMDYFEKNLSEGTIFVGGKNPVEDRDLYLVAVFVLLCFTVQGTGSCGWSVRRTEGLEVIPPRLCIKILSLQRLHPSTPTRSIFCSSSTEGEWLGSLKWSEKGTMTMGSAQ